MDDKKLPAFPSSKRHVQGNLYEVITDGGMTLRDYFAAKAMQAYIASQDRYDRHLKAFQPDAMNIPVQAYSIADAMMKERAK